MTTRFKVLKNLKHGNKKNWYFGHNPFWNAHVQLEFFVSSWCQCGEGDGLWSMKIHHWPKITLFNQLKIKFIRCLCSMMRIYYGKLADASYFHRKYRSDMCTRVSVLVHGVGILRRNKLFFLKNFFSPYFAIIFMFLKTLKMVDRVIVNITYLWLHSIVFNIWPKFAMLVMCNLILTWFI